MNEETLRNTAHDDAAGGQSPGPFPVGLSVFALLLCLGLFSFLHSSYFHLATVSVQGNDVLTEDELLDLAGIFPGDNVLQVDLQRLASRVASHPRVRHVHVHRRLPDTVVLIVQEHVPVALVPVAPEDGAAAESERTGADGETPDDADGTESEPMWQAVNEAGTSVPLFDGEAERLPMASEDTPELLSVAIAAAAHMPPSLRALVGTIDVQRSDDGLHIEAVTRTGGHILFGDAVELERKGAIASSLLDTEDYAVVDVRFPRSPTVRVR